MIFGKIDYLNLLPFYVYLKKNIHDTRLWSAIQYHRSYPAKINHLFKTRKVSGAFISSIESTKERCFDVGIVAHKEIQSVLVCGGKTEKDIESATSNRLANVLGIEGRVVIGDKALKLYHQNTNCKDLAKLWYQKHKLPFVFARFCYNNNYSTYSRWTKGFVKTKTKIPQYILNQKSAQSQIAKKDIQAYLKLVHYEIGNKSKMGLKKFLKEVKNLK